LRVGAWLGAGGQQHPQQEREDPHQQHCQQAAAAVVLGRAGTLLTALTAGTGTLLHIKSSMSSSMHSQKWKHCCMPEQLECTYLCMGVSGSMVGNIVGNIALLAVTLLLAVAWFMARGVSSCIGITSGSIIDCDGKQQLQPAGAAAWQFACMHVVAW